MQAITKYSELQAEVLKIIGGSKNNLEKAVSFGPETVVTDDTFDDDENILRMFPNKTERSTAIDAVLNIIYSTGMVFLGRYVDSNNGDLIYFYFDMVMLSGDSSWLVGRLEHFQKLGVEMRPSR